MNQPNVIKESRYVALISFIVGTTILLLFYYLKSASFLLIGLVYLFMAFVVNCIFLISLLQKLRIKEINKKQGLTSITVILINIPIAIAYYFCAMKIMSTIID